MKFLIISHLIDWFQSLSRLENWHWDATTSNFKFLESGLCLRAEAIECISLRKKRTWSKSVHLQQHSRVKEQFVCVCVWYQGRHEKLRWAVASSSTSTWRRHVAPSAAAPLLRLVATEYHPNDVTGLHHPTGASLAAQNGPPEPSGGPAWGCFRNPDDGAAGAGDAATPGYPNVLETPVCGRRPLLAGGGEVPGGGKYTRGVPHAAATEPRGAHPNPAEHSGSSLAPGPFAWQQKFSAPLRAPRNEFFLEAQTRISGRVLPLFLNVSIAYTIFWFWSIKHQP